MKVKNVLFLSIILSAVLFSCGSDDKEIVDEFDLRVKDDISLNTTILTIDGYESVLDSCRIEYFGGGYLFTSGIKEQEKDMLELIWFPSTKEPGTQFFSSITYMNNLDTLEINVPRGKLVVNRFELKEIDRLHDSIYIEGVFHVKMSDAYHTRDMKGQFSHHGIVGPNVWVGD